jgi:hypothetical protein
MVLSLIITPAVHYYLSGENGALLEESTPVAR